METCNALVSIIVPVYGTETYLPACIESICKQTHEHIQLILVDDQSPDKCPEICDAYAKRDPRITVIHQKNKGVSGARNAGLDSATGDYVMFVDSDDELYPNAVEILLRDAHAYHADVVSASKKRSNSRGQNVSVAEDDTCSVFQNDEPLLLSLSGDKNTNSACAKLFKASLIRNIRFKEGMNIHEDGFFVFQCYMKKPVLVQHNIFVYQYNLRENSNSQQIFSDKHRSMLAFCEQKKAIVSACCPQYEKEALNMEVRVSLQTLDLLCSTVDKSYKDLQKNCVKRVRQLHMYHKPINQHHKQLEWVVTHGLYPLYKKAVWFKYYR